MELIGKEETIEMYAWGCATCGCLMAMPKKLNDQLRSNHQTFYCISGHSNYYSKKTDMEEVEGKLMNEYSRNAQLENKIKELESRGIIDRIINKK